MIYVASLAAPVKKAYGELCMSTTMNKIIEQLALDPKVSGMDACVLGPKDVVGIFGTKLKAAMVNKHPDACIIYIYTKDKEGNLLDVPFKKLIKKISPESVQEAVDAVLNVQQVSAKDVVSRDTKAPKEIKSKPIGRRLGAGGVKGNLLSKKKAEDAPSQDTVKFDEATQLWYYMDPLRQMVYVDEESMRDLSPAEVQAQKEKLRVPDTEEDSDEDGDDIPVNVPEPDLPKAEPESEPEPKAEPAAPQVPQNTLERNIAEIRDFSDWSALKESLSRDSAIRELLEENSTFQGVVNMLNVLDTEIKGVYYDRGLSTQQKFDKIMEIGSRRSTLMAQKNDMITRKVLDIIESVTISARRTVDDLLVEHRSAMEQLIAHDKDITDETKIRELMKQRVAAEFELLAVIKGIINLFQAMDIEINETILKLDESLPSDNKFINNMIGEAIHLLTPSNSKTLAATMMRALQEKHSVFSAMQKNVEELIDSIHAILAKDEEIIEHYQYMVKMLKANRVEDAVIIDGILKNVLNVYIGAPETGRTATALTWSGCQSRRRNTLLIDLTGGSHLEDYGVIPIQWSEFISNRGQREFCIVQRDIEDIEEYHEFIAELKTMLDYYAYINVLVDSENTEAIKLLAKEALTINFITDCTNKSLEETAACYAHIDTDNVARKIIMIDPPINILKLADKIGADPTVVKCVTIPNIQKIKMCSVTGDQPYQYAEVRAVFEDAFR